MLRAALSPTPPGGPVLNRRAAEARLAFEVPGLVAALAVIPVMIIEERWATDGWLWLALTANWCIWAVFFVEYVTIVGLADRRLAYTRRAWLDVAIIVLSFPLLPHVLAAARLVRLARLARVLRLLRLVNTAAVLTRTGKAVRAVFGSHGLAYLVGMTAVLVAVFGALFAVVEPAADSFAEGLWWAVVTATTVGYGDITPVTTVGRLAGATLMLVGVGFVAATTAAVAARFVVEDEEETTTETHEIRERIDAVQAQLDRIESALAGLAIHR